jgi:Ca-activated chloride channel homolog
MRIFCFFLVLLTNCSLFAQRTITGTVGDAKGEPIVGASVLVKGTTTGTVTDIDGKFSIAVPKDAQKLVFSFVGYKTQEITLGANNVINVNLEESQLQEVVVTSIGHRATPRIIGLSYSNYGRDRKRAKNNTAFAQDSFNTEDYDHIVENSFKTTTDDPLSTFSIDVDKAS